MHRRWQLRGRDAEVKYGTSDSLIDLIARDSPEVDELALPHRTLGPVVNIGGARAVSQAGELARCPAAPCSTSRRAARELHSVRQLEEPVRVAIRLLLALPPLASRGHVPQPPLPLEPRRETRGALARWAGGVAAHAEGPARGVDVVRCAGLGAEEVPVPRRVAPLPPKQLARVENGTGKSRPDRLCLPFKPTLNRFREKMVK